MVVNTEVLIFLIVLNIHEWLFTGGSGKSIIGGGARYSYIHVLHHLFPLKVIVFTVCEHEYMNICPPPNYRLSGAPGFLLINIHHKKTFGLVIFFHFSNSRNLFPGGILIFDKKLNFQSNPGLPGLSGCSEPNTYK